MAWATKPIAGFAKRRSWMRNEGSGRNVTVTRNHSSGTFELAIFVGEMPRTGAPQKIRVRLTDDEVAEFIAFALESGIEPDKKKGPGGLFSTGNLYLD